MNEVKLKRIDESNFLDAFRLKMSSEQEKFVSHPIRSLAQAYVYYHQCTPFGIYHGDTMVGYAMVIYDDELEEYNIWHMMIDISQQGRGYGRAAIEACLDYIKEKPFGVSDRVVLTCNRENPKAIRLYRALGFRETGNEDEEEIELALQLKK